MSRQASFVGKQTNANQADDTSKDFKMFMGARVLWPADVSDQVLESCIQKTQSLLQELNANTEGHIIVEKLKQFMDQQYEPHWHVFSGTNFGSHVTHEKRNFIFFYIDKMAFLCYKMG